MTGKHWPTRLLTNLLCSNPSCGYTGEMEQTKVYVVDDTSLQSTGALQVVFGARLSTEGGSAVR